MITPLPERTMRIVRQLAATPAAVFAAWTDAESFKSWMCPGTTHLASAELDVRVGGCFRLVMRQAENETVLTGIYREIRPPERLVFTWVSPITRDHTTLVTVELRPHDDGTELILTHEGFPDEATASAHENGWQSIAAKLAAYFHQGV